MNPFLCHDSHSSLLPAQVRVPLSCTLVCPFATTSGWVTRNFTPPQDFRIEETRDWYSAVPCFKPSTKISFKSWVLYAHGSRHDRRTHCVSRTEPPSCCTRLMSLISWIIHRVVVLDPRRSQTHSSCRHRPFPGSPSVTVLPWHLLRTVLVTSSLLPSTLAHLPPPGPLRHVPRLVVWLKVGLVRSDPKYGGIDTRGRFRR